MADQASDSVPGQDRAPSLVSEQTLTSEGECRHERCGPVHRWLAADPWKLPQPCVLQQLGISAGGWFQGGMTMNAEDPADGFNASVLTNDRSNRFQMNQLWLYLERPVKTDGCGIDVGGRFDMFYGTDWRVAAAQSYRWENRFNNEDNLYGLSIPQLYGEVGINDLSVKMGHMTGILGYEIVPAIGNFFYSHSYALCYSEPILITGLMANYKVTDGWNVLGGFHRGFYMFEDWNENLNFQGGTTWTGPEGRLSLGYALDIGKNDPAAQSEQYVHSLVLKLQMTQKLLYVLQNDLGQTQDVAALTGQTAEWYGINQYLLYSIKPKWSAGLRAEWFRDDDGTRVGGLGSLGYRGWRGAGGYAGDFWDVALGLNWKPKANITLRPEVRWDWYNGPSSPLGPYPLPFGDGTKSSQFTLGTDLVVTY